MGKPKASAQTCLVSKLQQKNSVFSNFISLAGLHRGNKRLGKRVKIVKQLWQIVFALDPFSQDISYKIFFVLDTFGLKLPV